MSSEQQRRPATVEKEGDPTQLGVDRETNAVLISDDTAMDVFVDDDGTIIDETSAEDGYVTLTGIESDVRVTLQFRAQQDGEEDEN